MLDMTFGLITVQSNLVVNLLMGVSLILTKAFFYIVLPSANSAIPAAAQLPRQDTLTTHKLSVL